jgi:hypothetical protein
METELLQDLRTVNQAITQFVSEVSVAKASPHSQWHSLHLDSLTAQVIKVEKALPHLPPPELRGEELSAELLKYSVNLGLIKSTIQDLEPVLVERMRSIQKALARLEATGTWSASLKDLSK